MTGAIVVQTTVASLEAGERLAALLVSERLAACVQIAAIRSRYAWEGALQQQDEQLLLIKTAEALFEPLRARIRALHDYRTPEIIAVPVTAADTDYLAWIAEVTTAP